MPAGPSSHINVNNNQIVGIKTVLTQYSVVYKPVDGILLSDGYHNVIVKNVISNWYNGIYLGEDPVFFNNTLSWGSAGIPVWLSGSEVSSNIIEHNIFRNDNNTVVTGPT